MSANPFQIKSERGSGSGHFGSPVIIGNSGFLPNPSYQVARSLWRDTPFERVCRSNGTERVILRILVLTPLITAAPFHFF